jgi:alpha/beta superfamily hydrolase
MTGDEVFGNPVREVKTPDRIYHERGEEPIVFPSGDLQLEGLLVRGDPGGEAFVLCHPHPEYGGSMDNHVVTVMANALRDRGLSALRFNFRGVGKSEGRFGGGVGERLDLEAAIEALKTHLDPRGIHIGGYSFGAYVGLAVATLDERLDGCIAVAPPLALYDLDFARGYPKKKLFVAGENDPFCPPGRLRDWFDALKKPKMLRIISQTDHFFWGKEAALKQAFKDYFSL